MKENTINNPLVSVIIPCYNVSSYVEEGIGSIVNQSYKNLEIICIDDYSQDDTWVILNSMAEKDSRIKLYRNTCNLGLIGTLNLLINRSKSDLIVRMDPDDISDINRIQILVNKFLETGCYIISSEYRLIDKKGFRIKYKGLDILNTKYGIKFTAAFNSPIPHAPALIHKSILAKYEYRKDFRAAEDYDLWVRLLTDGFESFCIVREKLYSYRIIDTSESHVLKDDQILNHYRIAKRYVNEFIGLDLELLNVRISKKILDKGCYKNLSLLNISIEEIKIVRNYFFDKYLLSSDDIKGINIFTAEYIYTLFINFLRECNFIGKIILSFKIFLLFLTNWSILYNSLAIRWLIKKII